MVAMLIAKFDGDIQNWPPPTTELTRSS